MDEWGGERFSEFFQALWGRPPFAWQEALAERVLAAPAAAPAAWPQAIALPTASGKTACIDIAVYALAAQAGRTPSPRMPRRIFFVVDRRVIVDEAHARACLLADRLAAATDGILHEVALRLRSLAGGPVALAVEALRGGQPRLDAWAATPLQPTVVASTVDQVGSRLLFRGYGLQPGMWPIHAALVGNDALVLLDEAHCAVPMLQTLQAVQRWRLQASQPLALPFEVAVMSATPPPGTPADQVFADASPERLDPRHPLGQRQLASKRARLAPAIKARGRHAAQRSAAIAAELARHTFELAAGWPQDAVSRPAVVVFCNRVDTARRVQVLLAADNADAQLLTGRMRPLDKDDVVADALAPLATAVSGARRLAAPRFVVATQTLEVGADLDFDLLVTECASLDALRQRFGRLNRSGRPIDARAVIVAAAQDVDGTDDDPVYGGALRRTWAWLVHQAQSGSGGVNFGIAALDAVLPPAAELALLNAPAPDAPVLLPSHLDMLAQTAPQPAPSPDVAVFLHGPTTGPADVQVCWRADLKAGAPAADWLEALLHCPPSSPECLAVPLQQVRRWLDGHLPAQGADVEGIAEPDDERNDKERTELRGASGRVAMRWRGRDGSELVSEGARLRPGDVLVLPAAVGGLHELGTADAGALADLGDRAHAVMRRRAVLRLHPDLVANYPASDACRAALSRLLEPQSEDDWNADPAAFGADLRGVLRDWLPSLTGARWQWLHQLVQRVVRLRRLPLLRHPLGGWIIVLPPERDRTDTMAQQVQAAIAAFFGDEDDAASSGHVRSLLIEPQSDGHSHLTGVGALARHYGSRSGLPPMLVDTIGRAGDAHDLGKADPRFQSWLRNGLPWVSGPLLAKSAEMPQGAQASEAARRRAGYPSGGRHELLSIRLLESQPLLLPAEPALRDLLLHLVESHHGHCRPLAPVVDDLHPVEVRVQFNGQWLQAGSDTGLERLDAGPAARFWRLTRRHGWWGLAWLECVLRLADHRRSELEQLRAEQEAP